MTIGNPEELGRRWADLLAERAFDEILAALAALDRKLALETLGRIELMIGDELAQFRQKHPEGVTPADMERALAVTIEAAGEMMQTARELVDEVSQPPKD